MLEEKYLDKKYFILYTMYKKNKAESIKMIHPSWAIGTTMKKMIITLIILALDST